MAAEWRDCEWGDIARLEYGRGLKGYERESGKFPVYGTNGRIGWHDEPLCKHSSVIIGRKGAYRGIHFSASPFYVIDTAFYLEPNADLDLRWAYYSLLTQNINAMDSGSAIPSTSRDDFYRLPVRLPSKSEQTAIAQVLGSLDDKIELNRRMNETLEAIARAIFKSWFVDFDPVHAKAKGHETGLPKGIADLFPDRLKHSQLGEIPEGWKIATLGDLAENARSGVQPGEIDKYTPYIALEHMPRRSVALSAWGLADGLESNKFQFKRGEILFGKLRPYFHKVGIAPLDGVCSTDILVIKPREQKYFGFVFGHVSSVAFVEYTNTGSTGTKMPRTSWEQMSRYLIVEPTESAADSYNSQLMPLAERIIASIHESNALAVIRDALLPKLISGEIPVIEAEKMIDKC